MGSVKDLFIKRPLEGEALGEAYFAFSDRYSVFDWGEMPDKISGKGASLSMMAAFNFELMEEEDINTHYLGLREDGDVRKLGQLENPSAKMEILLARVPEVQFINGEYEYEDLRDKKNYVVPLEIIFRNSIPVGSSIRRRYKPGDLGYQYSSWPEEDLNLEEPLVEFSTKFEEKDRYVEDEEAEEISGLTESEFEELRNVAFQVNDLLNRQSREREYEHLDGKSECMYTDKGILVADVVGTFDENRFSYKGISLSKEFLRQWYKEEDSEWHQQVVEAQEKASKEGIDDWKGLVDKEPKNLPSEVLKTAENLYKAGANHWMGENLFDVPDLDQVVRRIKNE